MTEAPKAVKVAWPGNLLPLASKIVSHDDNFPAVQKRDIHFFAIRNQRAGSATLLRLFGFQRGIDHDLLRDDLASLPIEAKQDAIPAFHKSRGQEDPVAPDDRPGVAPARQGRLPCDVVAATPFRRDIGFKAGAIAARASPSRPVFTNNW